MGTKNTRSPGSQFTGKGVVQGSSLVSPIDGLPVAVIVDTNGVHRLAVDADLTADNITVDIRDLNYKTDSITIGDANTNATLLVNSDGSIDVNSVSSAQSGDSIAISAHPNQIFDEASGTITTTSFTQIYTYTSTNDLTRITHVESTAETPSTFVLKINGIIKRTLRSSPMERNIDFKFEENRTLLNGDILTVEAQVDRLIYTSYATFTSLEGYLT